MSNWKLIDAEATTNLLTNPSFEKDDSGWSAGSNWTLARSTDQAKWGAACGELTSSASAAQTMVSYAITLPTTDTDYTLSGWVYVDTGWDGGNIQMNYSSLSGASLSTVDIFTDGTDAYGTWHYIESTLTVASDVTGFITVWTNSAPGSSKTFSVDGLQVEQKSYATTYCDGDQPGCSWRAEAHASISRRKATAWQGGRVKDLEDDFSINVVWQNGAGTAETDLNVTEYALVSGGSYDFSRQRVRSWQMLCAVNGSSLTNYHALRKTFWEAINPNRFGGNDPVIIRYAGGSETIEATCVYAGGMEGAGKAGYYEDFPVRFVNPDPAWYTVGNAAAALSEEGGTLSSALLARIDETWDDWAASAGPMRVIAAYQGDIIAGGNPENIDGGASNDFIAAYDPAAELWSDLDSGVNNSVWALYVYNDELYVGGTFTTVGSGASTANGLAKWDGSSWDVTISPSASANVYAIVVDNTGRLWVGGGFTNFDGQATADYIAYSDDEGSTWSGLSTAGANAVVRVLTVDTVGNVWVGGNFTSIDGVTVSGVAYWDGSSWNRPGTKDLANVHTITLFADGRIAVGGTFTEGVATWNGTQWWTPSTYPNDAVYSLVWTGQTFLVGGLYTAIGNQNTGHLSTWDGVSWGSVGIEPDSDVLDILYQNGDIYLAKNSTGTASWEGTTSVTNNGTLAAQPVIRVKWSSGGTSARLAYIENKTNSRRLLLDYDMVLGEQIELDLRPGQYTMTSTQFGSQWKVLSNSDVTGFTLPPGNSNITLYVESAGSPTIEATLHYRTPYGSWDA